MRIAVIGTSGQLGFDLNRLLPLRGHIILPFAGRAQLNITKPKAIAKMLDSKKPDALINTAAFHNVDLCEKETDAAYRTNVVAVRELAAACEARGIRFIQIGTDYVMEGWPDSKPLSESASVHPNSIYSITRFGGDCMTLAYAPTVGYVVRTCGLFGIAGCKLKGGLNFVDTMIKMARAITAPSVPPKGKKKPPAEAAPSPPRILRVVDDQIVSPTPTDALAEQLAVILEAGPEKLPPGLYHAVSHGETSWYNFAKTALKLAGLPPVIEPVPSSAYAAPAKRPRYSVLDNAKLRAANLDIMPTWQDALEKYVAEKYPQNNAGKI